MALPSSMRPASLHCQSSPIFISSFPLKIISHIVPTYIYSMVSTTFPLPGVNHGKRILASVIEKRAEDSSIRPWISVPINEQDLSAGYRDITFRKLNNAANNAAYWLSQNLPETSELFQCFAYAGPKDLRYPILAVAAAKLNKVVGETVLNN